jgi:putative phosphoesterase
VQIAIIGDTHMPRGRRRLPSGCIERLRGADLILHTGDFMSASVLHQLQGYGEVVAVHGNVDDAELRALLPARREIEVDGLKVGLVHDAGPARGRLARLHEQFPGSGAVVFGHSHIPLHERSDDGFQIFNPGSPTERRRAPSRTMGLARVQGRKITFELIALC